MKVVMVIENCTGITLSPADWFPSDRWALFYWQNIPVPAPIQFGCYPLEGEVGVRINTGRWGTNRWATIEPLQHPYEDDGRSLL